MYISFLRLKNWRNFKDISFPLTERVFLVGPNASGKSNLLDALRFLKDVAKDGGGLQTAINERGGITKIRCLAARTETQIEIEVHLSDSEKRTDEPEWKYFLGFRHQEGTGGVKKNYAIVENEMVSRGKARVLSRTKTSSNEDKETLRETSLEHASTNKNFRPVYDFFNELQYLHIVPQLVRDADSYFLSKNKEDYFGRNLLMRMASTNAKTRDSHLKKISEFLKIAVPQLEELNFIKDEATGTPHLESRFKHWRNRPARQNETEFSDGTLRMIGFFWALLDGKETILLEEPELYLNSAIVKEIPRFISKLQRRGNRTRQVILTTHSYDLLDTNSISAEEIIILESDKEGARARSANSIKEVQDKLKAGFSVAESVIPITSPKGLQSIDLGVFS